MSGLQRCLSVMALVWGLVVTSAGAQVPAGFFSYAMPYNDTLAGVATDVSWLNVKPAGKNGGLVVRNGVFVEANTGTRVRLFGTNLTAGEAFPPTAADAAMIAKRLAKGGVNVVRLHHLDNTWAVGSGSIWDPTRADHQFFSAIMLDRLDRLVAELKKNGIYVNLNLKVSKDLSADDGFAASVRQIPWGFQKRVDFYQRRMIDLQKDYARKLLTHVNPYTGLSYAKDPAVAVVEINNENSLVGFWTRTLGKDLEQIPEPFKGELVTMWNTWLKARYTDQASLVAAWNVGQTPPGDSILTSTMSWYGEQHNGVVMTTTPLATPVGKTAPNVSFNITTVTGTDWHAQATISGLTLQEGATYTVKYRARSSAARPIGVYTSQAGGDYHNMGLQATVNLPGGWAWTNQQHVFKATNTVAGQARIAYTLGQAVGTVEIADLTLAPGSTAAGLQPGESLAAGNIGMPTLYTEAQWADWIRFLADTERAYADEMLSLLKTELGVKASVNLTQIDYGGMTGLHREARMDVTDSHSYWQHPSFPGSGWDPNNWFISNSPMVNTFSATGMGEMGNLAMWRVAGRPFGVSEFDHPAPSDYASEMIAEWATFASIQDWDALYTFCGSDYRASAAPNRIQGFFDQNNHPGKWAFYPTAALIFRKGLVAPASATSKLELPNPLWKTHHFADDARRAALNGAPIGFLTHKLQVSNVPVASLSAPRLTVTGTPAATPQARILTNANGKVYVVSAPSAAAFVGFIGGQTITADALTLKTATFDRNFASVTAVATDSKAFGSSSKILVTLAGRVENQNMGWNAARTTVNNNWGNGPTVVQFVPATLTIPAPSNAKVYALDPNGRRKKTLISTYSSGKITFSPTLADAAMHYEIAAQSNVKLTGTSIGTAGSFGSKGNDRTKALDGNLATFFDAPTSSTSWVGLDLGSTKSIRQVKYAPRSGFPSRMVNGVIQASTTADFSSGVTTLLTISAAPTTGTLTTATLPTTTAKYRYVRYKGPKSSYCNIAELEFWGN